MDPEIDRRLQALEDYVTQHQQWVLDKARYDGEVAQQLKGINSAIEKLNTSIDKLNGRMDQLASQPVKRYDTIVTVSLTAAVTYVVTLFLQAFHVE